MPKGKGHDKSTKEGKDFFKKIKQLAKLEVCIGFQRGSNTNDDGVDMVDIAVWNELGTAKMPARPFLRHTADNNKTNIEKLAVLKFKEILNGKTEEEALNDIGIIIKALVQDTITHSKDWAIENKQSTIKRKKSDTPLIDTGQMLQAVNYFIKEKGDKT